MKKYIKTFSRREISSAFYSSLMFYAFLFVIKNFNLGVGRYFVDAIALSLPLLLSHRFYLIEHGRRNRFLGRILHDSLIALMLFVLGPVLFSIAGIYHQIGFLSNLVLICIVMVLTGELILTALMKITRRLGWQIC